MQQHLNEDQCNAFQMTKYNGVTLCYITVVQAIGRKQVWNSKELIWPYNSIPKWTTLSPGNNHYPATQQAGMNPKICHLCPLPSTPNQDHVEAHNPYQSPSNNEGGKLVMHVNGVMHKLTLKIRRSHTTTASQWMQCFQEVNKRLENKRNKEGERVALLWLQHHFVKLWGSVRHDNVL